MNTFSKLAFFAFLPFLFLSATAADETYDPFIKTLSGRVKDESKRKGSLHLFFLEVVKDKETKIYTIRGVMAKPQERPYIWKGTGTVKNGSISFSYSDTGEGSGEAKFYSNKEGSMELLFNGEVYELHETQ